MFSKGNVRYLPSARRRITFRYLPLPPVMTLALLCLAKVMSVIFHPPQADYLPITSANSRYDAHPPIYLLFFPPQITMLIKLFEKSGGIIVQLIYFRNFAAT